MKFLENESIIEYSCDKEHYLNHGEEVDVYLFDDEVVKVFKSSDTTRLRIEKDFCDKLCTIKTERILLPKKTLLDEKTKKLNAYTMDYIEDYGKDNFFLLPSDELSHEMEIVRNDINSLSDHQVLINDLDNIRNIFFHNGIYLIDPGSYDFRKSDKKGIRTYAQNLKEINNFLIRLIGNKTSKICKDSDKARLMIKELKKEIYKDGSNPLDYLIDGINADNLLDLINKRLEKLECKVKINGKEVNLNRDYKRIYIDDAKEIYLNKESDKKLYLYKTDKNEIKLTQNELKKLSDVSTSRIMTPIGSIETSKDECKAYQIISKSNYSEDLIEIEGNRASKELELLKHDAIALAKKGIYIGKLTEEDTLYSEGSIYIKCIENFEKVDEENIEEKNIESLNGLISDIIMNQLYETTTLRNICSVMTDVKEKSNNGYLGDLLKEELQQAPTLRECVKTMVKTREK